MLDQLPHESIAYLGDTARQPYGPRPIAEVREFALECLDHLVDHGVKAARHRLQLRASAAVLHDARERYDVPVVEVIRPAVRRAVAATRNGRVGVICTQATHQRRAYVDAFAAAPHLEVTSRPCPRFVEFVEAGVTGGARAARASPTSTSPRSRRTGVDTLVLGCTHYPLLTGVISYVMGDDVTLVSSAEETAKDVYRVLADADLLRPDDLPRADATSSSRPATRTSSRGWRAGSSGPRSAADRARSEAVAQRDEADRRRAAPGRFAGPGLARVLLPRRGRARRAAPGASCSTSAAARSGRCSGTSTSRDARRRRPQPPAPRPLHRPVRPYVAQQLRARAARPAAVPVYGPAGTAERMAEAYGARRPGGMGAELRLPRPRPTASRVAVGPVHGHAVPGRPPGRGLRPPGRGRTARALAYTGDTDACDGADAAVPGRRPASSPTPPFVDGRDDAAGIHLSGRRAGAGGGRGRRRAAADAHPPAAVERPARCAARRPAAVWPGRASSLAPRTGVDVDRLSPTGSAVCRRLRPRPRHRRRHDGRAPTSPATVRSPAAGSTTPRAACSSSSAAPGCCAPRRSPRACRAGARARARAG